MANILITGSHGFIGSHLGNKLGELGHSVVGVDDLSHSAQNEITFQHLQEDFASLSDDVIRQADVIFHLAAHINVDESIEKPLEYLENNAVKTVQLLEQVKRVKKEVKFIYASSAEVYGSARQESMNEEHPLDPLSPYAVSKLSAEQECKNCSQLYGMDITIIRNFNTFGEHQRDGMYGGVIAKFARLGKEGQPLPVYGTGEQSRDYMYISQAVDGYILAMERKLPLIINFGSGSEVKVIDIANYIASRFGVRIVHELPRLNEIMRLRADVSRAVRYGYQLQTDFWKHLEDYLSWVESNGVDRYGQ